MKIKCVYSRESITPPQMEATCSINDITTTPQGLSCAGYGASMLVTASFGLFCAQAAIDHICKI